MTTAPSTTTATTHPTDPSTRHHRTEHYSTRSNQKPEPRIRTTRSKGSHLGIVIIWQGPAFGRPQPPLRAVDHRNDLGKIVSVGERVAVASAVLRVLVRAPRSRPSC